MPRKKPAAKATPSQFRKGQKATMLFHLIGLTSEEEHEVLSVHKDGSITLRTDEDPRRCFRFDTRTGRCLNDSTDMGASRTLKVPKMAQEAIHKGQCHHKNRSVHNAFDGDGDEWEECLDCGAIL